MPSENITDTEKIMNGREMVDIYRAAHTELHSHGWHKGISEEHTPLLNTLLKSFEEQGFNTTQEFFAASKEMNIKELGFISMEDFLATATKLDEEALMEMWN